MTGYQYKGMTEDEQNKIMGEGYWARWNKDVQAKIDHDIEVNRKADARVRIPGIPAGADVQVEQLTHDFIFGAHIFNFDQLGDDTANAKYKDLYGDLFNSATISFYWKQLELEEGKPRFRAEYRDTADFWNKCEHPEYQPHWRRPAVDPVVDFCLSKGIRLHGHVLCWGSNRWQIPDWLINRIPFDYLKKANLERDPRNNCLTSEATSASFKGMTPEEMAEKMPEYTTLINVLMAKRIMEIALRYGDKVNSWDVCNESATDFSSGNMIPGSKICNSWYGPMPGDYTYRSFKIAEGMFPEKAKLNINDYNLGQCYTDQVKDLIRRGCKIDIMGAQMHLFDPKTCLDIAAGTSDEQCPDNVWSTMERLAQAERPIHLSEITITAPNNDERGQAIQSVITRNLYRLWFSIKPMMGITWWNVVDGCGAPGEPSVSGIFSKKMDPKPAYFAMNDLINNQWKTRLTAKAGKDGAVEFRGFRGQYRLTWTDETGKEQTAKCHVG